MAKDILVSGIQPSGRLHLGNYLGALKNFVDLQNSGKYQCLFFVADYHSLTQDTKNLGNKTMDLLASYLAAGLDPKKSLIFVQSVVHHSPELAWILNTIAPVGEMERMTQFKEKSQQQKQNINIGLLTYPTLMAADVLLYDAKFVPVGHDQLQHLELARTLARKFNSKFGKVFIEPKSVLAKTPRVMSLDNPEKKMSKSMPSGCLFLDDSPNTVREKVKKAVTDSGKEVVYSLERKPAISNLLSIYSELSGQSIRNIERKFDGAGYGDLKKDLAEVIIKHLKPFREKKAKLKKQAAKIKKIADAGNKKAHELAKKKMLEVKKKIDLYK